MNDVALLAIILAVLWVISLAISNSSIIDLFWGPAFSVIYWPTALQTGLSARSILVGSLVSLWGLRLGIYLAWRNLGHGEDKRYTAMRKRHGAAWWWRSFFIVFVLQGVLAWVVAWPVRVVASTGSITDISVADFIATGIVIFGIGFESLGDWQLARFRKRRGSAPHPAILNTGLWRYTRHPNYFGDFVIWIGFGVFGLSTGAWWSLVGPAVMTVLLVQVSGKALLEKGMKDRPGYAEYVANTSGFIPWPPRRS
ncbi:MAG: DUF1295 domain-containing protein [Archangium sp.]